MPLRHDATLDVQPADLSACGQALWPIDGACLQGLLEHAWRSALGQGPLTKVDVSVREAWEVHQVDGLNHPDWASAVQHALDQASEVLRLGGPVEARFDKLVIYGPDGHFDRHRDTLRADGHVATLIIRLQSADAGGRLWVGAHRPVADPAAGDNGLPCTVFHTDVPHRVEPVEEGWRVALVYQVHRSGPARALTDEAPPAESTVYPVGGVAGGQVALLRHRYSHGALMAGALVGDDRALAAAWLADDPEVQLDVALLSGLVEEHFGVELKVSVEVAGEEMDVYPSALMAAALREHLAPGGFSGWTGNEGTASVYRYRGAALVRRPGPVQALHPILDDDTLLTRGVVELAEHALAQGWTTWDESLWEGAAPEHLLPSLQELMFEGATDERVAALGRLPGLRRLRLGADGPMRLPPLVGVEEVLLPDAVRVGVELNLCNTPSLRRLHWDGEVVGRLPHDGAQVSLFPTAAPATGAGLWHAVVSNHRGKLPEGLCTVHLRTLDFGTRFHGEAVSGLTALREAPHLRRLALRGLASLTGLPWRALPDLTHLTLQRGSNRKELLVLPAACQELLESLESLSLCGVDLSAVDLSRCTRLHTLHLDRCSGVVAPPPGHALRSLRLDYTLMHFPASLPRLESLRVTGVADVLALARCPPRLRELHLASLAGAELGALDGASLRSLHLEDLGSLSHPSHWVLPQLEALTLRKLPVGNVVAWGPLLRVLRVEDVPVESLPQTPAPELVEVYLEDLEELTSLPAWLWQSTCLETLWGIHLAVASLPTLAGMTALHDLAWYGPEVTVDQGLVDALEAAPVLTTVQLVPPDPEDGDLSLGGQLYAAGWQPPQEVSPAGAGPDAGDDDDIPF